MTYLLDTNAVSDAATNHPVLRARFEQARANQVIGICPITLGEILFGLARMPPGKRRDSTRKSTMMLIDSMACFAIPPEAAEYYSQAKLHCFQRGVPRDGKRFMDRRNRAGSRRHAGYARC